MASNKENYEEEIDDSELRRKIEERRFEGGSFIVLLVLCLIKDAIDIFTLGLAGTITNLFITPFLFIFFFMRGSYVMRKLIRGFIWPIAIEFIPGINAFPTYTIMALLLKFNLDKKVKHLELLLKVV